MGFFCLCNKFLSSQALRIMKLTIIILIGVCLQVSAKGYGQNLVTLNEKDATLASVLNKIKQQTNIVIWYRSDLLDRPCDDARRRPGKCSFLSTSRATTRGDVGGTRMPAPIDEYGTRRSCEPETSVVLYLEIGVSKPWRPGTGVDGDCVEGMRNSWDRAVACWNSAWRLALTGAGAAQQQAPRASLS